MDEDYKRLVSDRVMEILPPDRNDLRFAETATCLCCRRQRLASSMDEDGCGICEECLRP
jgi:hypothetical protein